MLEEKYMLETGPESSPPVTGNGSLGQSVEGGESGPWGVASATRGWRGSGT